MNKLIGFIFLVLVGFGLFTLDRNHPDLKFKALEFVQKKSFHTLEIRFTAEQIMERYKSMLIKDARHTFLEPSLKFYPYLLMEVKYLDRSHRTGEGKVLWDLVDGEMVINTQNWEKTHGFGDCLQSQASRQEFKIINTLAQRGGAIDRERLVRELNMDDEVLDDWIDSCRKKKLIVQTGNELRIHLHNPKLYVVPVTLVDVPIVSKPQKEAVLVPKYFSSFQIEKVAKFAFGHEFAIRSTRVVYLPIHCISIKNPDDSVHTSHWNALNGQMLLNDPHLE